MVPSDGGQSAAFSVMLWMILCVVSTSASDDHTGVKVRPGQNATLECHSPTDEAITLLEWSRPELKSSGYVLFYRNQRPYEKYQHEFFKGRVELSDPSVKDGDVSVILRNVSIRDAGTYECLITTSSIRSGERVITEFKHSINLTVTASDEETEDGGKYGEHTVVIITVVSVLAVIAIVLATAVAIKCRKQNFLHVKQHEMSDSFKT